MKYLGWLARLTFVSFWGFFVWAAILQIGHKPSCEVYTAWSMSRVVFTITMIMVLGFLAGVEHGRQSQ